MCAYGEEQQKWLEKKFAVGRLDTALIVLTSFSGTAFTIGNAVFGKELITYLLPLYFIGWMMPILSGYFIGAVIRNDLVDRMRGWLYLLAGTPVYLASPLIGLYLPLWSFYQLDPMNAVKSVFLFAFLHIFVVFLATMISFWVVKKLFSNASLQEGEGIIQKRSIALTSIAIALFTGAIGSFYIWSSFGITMQLVLETAAIFLLGFLFEYLALLTTRSRVHLRNSEQPLIQHETTSNQESRKSVANSASARAVIDELNEELWKSSDKICEECRGRRSIFGCIDLEKNRIWKKEKAKVDFYCPPHLGFFHAENLDENSFYQKNVFFVLESMGGGRPWKRKGDITFEEPMEELEKYYLSEGIKRFHQYCIREILAKMDERNIPFFVTDVVKCFVVRSNRKNFATAAEICSTNFLRKQIFTLKPKVIVVFGGLARDALKGFAANENKSKFVTLHTENHSKRIDIELTEKEQHFETSLIYSVFPTANRNADDWVRLEAKENLLKAIYKAEGI